MRRCLFVLAVGFQTCPSPLRRSELARHVSDPVGRRSSQMIHRLYTCSTAELPNTRADVILFVHRNTQGSRTWMQTICHCFGLSDSCRGLPSASLLICSALSTIHVPAHAEQNMAETRSVRNCGRPCVPRFASRSDMSHSVRSLRTSGLQMQIEHGPPCNRWAIASSRKTIGGHALPRTRYGCPVLPSGDLRERMILLIHLCLVEAVLALPASMDSIPTTRHISCPSPEAQLQHRYCA